MKTDREIVREIIADAERDAEALDGMPFTGGTIGDQFGKTLAMIQALARIVDRNLPANRPS